MTKDFKLRTKTHKKSPTRRIHPNTARAQHTHVGSVQLRRLCVFNTAFTAHGDTQVEIILVSAKDWAIQRTTTKSDRLGGNRRNNTPDVVNYQYWQQ